MSYKDRKPFCAAMRPIYTAPNVDAAELAMDRFEQTWGGRYPMSVASWRRHWDGLTAFFKYPVEFRRLIWGCNANCVNRRSSYSASPTSGLSRSPKMTAS